MRRGEGFVSMKRGGGMKLDPLMLAVIFGIGGVIFLILTIVVPAVMISNAEDELCGPTDVLRRSEQQLCSPSVENDYTLRADSKGKKFVKSYRVKRADLRQMPKTVRNMVYDGSANLALGTLALPLTGTNAVSFVMSFSCEGSFCNTAKLWWLSSASYKKATAKGSFDESMYNHKMDDLTKPKTFQNGFDGSDTYYFVFSNSKQDSTITYNISAKYTVYDLKDVKYTAFDSKKDELVFKDVATDESIVMEYMDTTFSGPAMIDATIAAEESNTGLVVFLTLLFIILTLGCFAVTIVLLLIMFGKLGRFGEKVGKKFAEQDSGSYMAPEVAEDTVQITREVVYTDE